MLAKVALVLAYVLNLGVFDAWGSTFSELVQARSSKPSNSTDLPDLYEASIVELQNGLVSRAFTSVDLVKVVSDTVKATMG